MTDHIIIIFIRYTIARISFHKNNVREIVNIKDLYAILYHLQVAGTVIKAKQCKTTVLIVDDDTDTLTVTGGAYSTQVSKLMLLQIRLQHYIIFKMIANTAKFSYLILGCPALTGFQLVRKVKDL
jgi:hypothetical protein